MRKELHVTPEELIEKLADNAAVNIPSMIWGMAGIGKSQLVDQFKDKYIFIKIDERLSQSQPIDLKGIPDMSANRLTFLPPDLPLQGDEVPEGKNGWVLFLDELTNAEKSVEAAALKILCDRMVGNYHLHERVIIVAAGNRQEDSALANELSAPTRSRMCHFILKPDIKSFTDYAISNNWSDKITGYLAFRPDSMYDINYDDTDYGYNCPRTWEMMNKLITQRWKDEVTMSHLKHVCGILGEAVGLEFVNYCQVYLDIPTIEEIKTNPTTAKLPDGASQQYAICSLIAKQMTKENASSLLRYVKRCKTDLQGMIISQAIKRYPLLTTEPEFTALTNELGLIYED